MKADVQTVLAALRVERAAIDKAIDGLQQMTELRGARPASVSARAVKTKPKPKRHRRANLTPQERAAIAARLANSGGQRGAISAIAREFGVSHTSIVAIRNLKNNGTEQPSSTANDVQ